MIAKKHGECAGFVDFEAQFGSEAATSVLERVCDAMWSRNSGYGISIDDMVAHDACNHTADGRIEHEGVWYSFTIRNGNFDGTQVENFELFEDPPEHEVDLSVSAPHLLQACLAQYLEAAPHVREASNAALWTLRTRFKPGRVSAAPQQVHQMLRSILGDLAFPMPDYDVEALATAARTMTSAAAAEGLFGLLTLDLQEAVMLASQQCPSTGTPSEFLVAGLAPVFAEKFF